MLLQIDSIPNSVYLNVSPYNAAAYGVLIFILVTAVITLYRKNLAQEKYNYELVEKIHKLQEETGEKLTEIKIRMNDQNAMMKTLEYIKLRIDDIIK